MKQELPVQTTVMDLSTFEEVTIGKKFSYEPVSSIQEALSRLNGDSSELVSIVNQGLASRARADVKNDPNGWFKVPEGSQIGSLDLSTAETFDGIMADKAKVNAAVLLLAKTIFGYSKELSATDKEAAKQSAIDMIKATPVIFQGMQKSCALTPVSAESGE